MLKAVAAHLERPVLTLDTVARYGGEEFVITFPDTPLEGTRATIDRVLHRLWAQPVAEVDGQPLHLSFSAGIACHQPSALFAPAHACSMPLSVRPTGPRGRAATRWPSISLPRMTIWPECLQGTSPASRIQCVLRPPAAHGFR